MAKDCSLDTPLLNSIEDSNQNHINYAIETIKNKGKRKIGIFGISFKEGTDDLRYSPIIKVIEDLIKQDLEVLVYDNFVSNALQFGANKEYIDNILPYLQNILVNTEDELIEWAELIIFNHKYSDYQKLIKIHTDKIFIDFIHISESITDNNYEGLCW